MTEAQRRAEILFLALEQWLAAHLAGAPMAETRAALKAAIAALIGDGADRSTGMSGLHLVTDGTSLRLVYGRLDEGGAPDPRWTTRFVPQAETVEALRAQLEAALAALDQEPVPAAPFSYPPLRGVAGLPDVPPGGSQG